MDRADDLGQSLTSYDLDQLDRGAELRRLERQAAVALDRERAAVAGLGVDPGATVLDLGCGPGLMSARLLELVPSGALIGVDADPALLARARARCAGAGARARFVEAWADALPIDDQSVDLVYARFLFQHLPRPLGVLAELRRVLRPGGRVCVLDTDDGNLLVHPPPIGLDRLLAASAAGQRGRGGDRHVGRKLRGLLIQAGFVDVGVRLEPFTAEAAGWEAFVDVTMGYKRQIVDPALMAPDEADVVIAALRALSAEGGAWAQTAAYFAVGLRPVDAV